MRALPDFKAATIYRLTPLERFRALRADMSVTRAGSARTEYTIAADVSRGWPSLPIGTHIDILDYAGEGQFGIWAAGRQWDAGSFWSRDPSPRQPARLLQAPQMNWWIQVEAIGGQRGWLGLRNTAEDGMGMVFDETLRMSVGSGAADDADCTELLKNRDLE